MTSPWLHRWLGRRPLEKGWGVLFWNGRDANMTYWSLTPGILQVSQTVARLICTLIQTLIATHNMKRWKIDCLMVYLGLMGWTVLLLDHCCWPSKNTYIHIFNIRVSPAYDVVCFITSELIKLTLHAVVYYCVECQFFRLRCYICTDSYNLEISWKQH